MLLLLQHVADESLPLRDPWLPASCQLTRATAHVRRHYLLVDAQEEGWGQEITFRSELLDFISFRYASFGGSRTQLQRLTSRINSRRVFQGKNDEEDGEEEYGDEEEPKRRVPVITFVFGGGDGTIRTVLKHIILKDP